MSSNQDKKRWKKEAIQLKKDLDSRKKIIRTREVPITFKSSSKPLQKGISNSKSLVLDDISRKLLGI